ncbi:aminotransferase class I/II-fold pyridoxal phosphate-dependent enzyme [Plantactinospora sp. BB1]|uniref:aminotransferase class I/II-fold pyridoxal phosphate-dependent enzyme n=1 Tax=Plantactinospora sp. BB1 TaxID=2071627 RepID=UPI000D16C84E|nr:aminotransferase class I/II-fold pyridoxal phosphate-dependent enzyme [Plantactinospora sp. BB1]AVT38625.1 3-amino-5-hydroxybenzoic acid synthase [Plantactinospora sp. BB1]
MDVVAISRQSLDLPRWPQFDDREKAALLRALEQSGWWRFDGHEVSEFEKEFAGYHGARKALAVTSGTHALELALQVVGVGPGTEVIVPAFTFISSSQAAQRLGAVAVPVDVDPVTYCMDVPAAEAAITERTRAIMPVHMAGLLAGIDALGKLSDDSGVPLVHDAAHAHGAQWRGLRLGELASIATYSFQNGKLMTAGEGGAVTFSDAQEYEAAFLRHSCGRPRADRAYRHEVSGSNFRMNEFSASVLRVQLARLDEQIDIRERRWPVLADLLARIPGVLPQGSDEGCTRNPHYMAMFRVPGITAERRQTLVDEMVARGVPAFAAFRAIYRTSAFWEAAAPAEDVESIARRCPNVEAITNDCIWLHHRALLGTEEQMSAIAEVVSDVVGNTVASS